ncbi:MAG: RNA polymerase sigma factor [Patescibacteria group bacterium]
MERALPGNIEFIRIPATRAEADLIDKAQVGDSHALGQIFEKFRPGIYSHAQAMVGNEETAEDLTQHAFLRAVEALPRYVHKGISMNYWLLRIVHNLGVDYLRGKKNEVSLHTVVDNDLLPAPDAHEPQTAVERSFEIDRVNEIARNVLTVDQRNVIRLRVIEDRKYDEIADKVGLSAGNIRVIKNRAQSRLNRVIEREIELEDSDVA